MEIDIIDFVSFSQIKNGKYKIVHDESKRDNIFKLLREMGFGFIRQKSAYIYFKKEASSVKPATFGDFQRAFLDAIKKCDSELPGDLNILDVYKHFRKYPIKRNAVFPQYFEHTLVANEVRHFVLQHKFDIEEQVLMG